MEFVLPGPNTLDVLAVSLDNPFITLESYKPDGLTRTTLQSAANDREGHRVIGAVNADFFSFETGWPVGNQVVNGTWAHGVHAVRSHLAIDTAGQPFIERLAFSGRIRARDGSSFAVSSVNTNRAAGTLVVYTGFRGPTTETDGTGMECVLTFLSPSVAAGDTLSAIVTTKVPGGDSDIPASACILSAAAGAPTTFVTNSLNIGDTVQLYLGFTPPLRSILQVLGGAGRFLLDGRNVTDSMSTFEGIGPSFTAVRHPRTFVGFNRDTTTIYLCTVDGRQSSSIGMTFAEMADFLLSIGAWEGFNFDGGGSTTMVVRGDVVNSPSDPAGERSVANSLQVISTAPLGSLHRLDLQPKRVELFQGGSRQFTASGFDEYYNPIALPPAVDWECSPSLGSISASGHFTAALTNDSGWVFVRWNTVVDSAFVVSRVLSALRVYPTCLVMVPGEQVTLVALARDNAGSSFTLDNRHLSFFPTGIHINADATGLITARDFGTGQLSIQLDTLHAAIPYDLRGTDTSIVIDPMESLSSWDTTLTGLQQGDVQVTLSGDHGAPGASAMKIEFAFPEAKASVMLNTSMPLSGRIDSLVLRVFGSGNADTIRFLVKDKDNQSFQVTPTSAIDWAGEWRTLGVVMSRAIPLGGGTLDYPVTVTGIRIDPGRANLSGGTIAGTLLLDDLGAHYPLRTVAPQVLFDFESGVGGWLTPAQSNAAQLKGINIAASSLAQSADRAYQGSYCGKWTFVDDASSGVDWDVRMTRGTSSDLGSMLRGSYVGAWVYAEGETSTQLQIAIRDGNGQICAGPLFPVRHYGWKLIGTKLDEDLFAPYLTSGKITDAGNKFNGFRLRGSDAVLSGQSRTVYIDKLVTSALTVPTGFIAFTAEWSAPLVRLHWAVNSEISINRYAVERGTGTAFEEIMSQAGRGNIDTTIHYEVMDTPPAGTVVHYRIRQITNDGGQELSQTIVVNTASNSVGPGSDVPESYQLLQNFPNPFNPSTTFGFALPVDSHVRLVVYNTLGQVVAEVLNSVRRAGYHRQVWSPSLASGVYFYRMEANGVNDSQSRFLDTRAMVYVK
ncbi:MAG: phosphodiester glycosidase family protein [Bacteroidetes bacterium]|nr:phosphodiester glycosidase family protein [Bacteroidota bacterium]